MRLHEVGHPGSTGDADFVETSTFPGRTRIDVHKNAQLTPQTTIERIEALRRQRLIGKAITAQTAASPVTVSRILRWLGLNWLSTLEPAEPPRRYQCGRPGEFVHIDIKKLGKFNRAGHRVTGQRAGNRNRGVGW